MPGINKGIPVNELPSARIAEHIKLIDISTGHHGNLGEDVPQGAISPVAFPLASQTLIIGKTALRKQRCNKDYTGILGKRRKFEGMFLCHTFHAMDSDED